MLRLIAALALFLVALPSNTQTTLDPATARTAGFTNGRMWKSADEGRRIWYLVGALDSLNMSCKTETKNTFSAALTISETVKSLDKFYEEPANIASPVPFAMTIVKMKADGYPAKSIEETTETGRRLAVQ